MTIGVNTIGEAPIGAEGLLVDPNAIDLSATIELDNRPSIDLWANIELRLTEEVSLSAPVELNTGHIELTAPVELALTEEISLTAPIEIAPVDQALVNRAAGNWKLRVEIDGVDYSARLTGVVTIDQSEDSSGIANLTIIPVAGPIVPGDYIGKQVKIDWLDLDSAGATNFELTRYIGLISDPIFVPETGELNIQCTTDIQGALDATTRSAIDQLTPDAVWSPNVFEEGADGWEYAQDRLRTMPASMWHSPSGVIVTAWAAKATPDFTFTDAELFQAGPYQPGTRRDLLNTIEINFDYRFERKRQRTIQCNWQTSQTWCEYLVKGYTLCQKVMVENAANSEGWEVQGSILFDPVPYSDGYKCFSGTAQNWIAWVNPPGGYIDQTFCIGARWKAAKRWLQTVTERYNIKLTAAQSIAGNGTIANREQYSLESQYDATDWLTRQRFSTADADTADYDGVGGNISSDGYRLGDIAEDATTHPDTGRDAANLARSAMIEAGVVDILRAHRQNNAPCVVSFQPLVDLTKTVRIQSAHITAKGKVRRMRDILNIETGDAITELRLAISRHDGTGLVTTSPLDPVAPPNKPVETGIPTSVLMQTYIGGTKTSQQIQDDWIGYFTNWIWDPNDNDPFGSDPNNPQTVSYPRQFIVDYPEISGGALDSFELGSDQELEVEIPNDELTLTQ